MRKTIAVLMMIFVVVFFYSSIQRRQPKNQDKKEIIDLIQETQDSLQDNYPDNSIDLVEIHNKMVNFLYGKELTDEEREKAVKVQRELYSKEFLKPNPIEIHLLEVDREIAINAEKEIKVIGSKVINSYDDPPSAVVVQVVHYTNQKDQDLIREYKVKKDFQSDNNGQWRISGWENIGVIKTQEEEE